MWLVSTQGFYSVVCHRRDPDNLIVRRDMSERLCTGTSGASSSVCSAKATAEPHGISSRFLYVE